MCELVALLILFFLPSAEPYGCAFQVDWAAGDDVTDEDHQHNQSGTFWIYLLCLVFCTNCVSFVCDVIVCKLKMN